MLKAISTTAREDSMNRIADITSMPAQKMVNMREILSCFRSSKFLPKNGMYKSCIVDDASDVIDPARVDIAAANNPATIIPDIPAGRTLIMNKGKMKI